MRTVTSIFSLVNLFICFATPLDVKFPSNTNMFYDVSNAVSNNLENAFNGAKDALIGTLSSSANTKPSNEGNVAHILLADISNM